MLANFTPHLFIRSNQSGLRYLLIVGEPQTGAHRLMEQKAESLNSLTTFFAGMSQLYEDPQQTATAEATLHALQQGHRAGEDYVAEFRHWSFDTNWSDSALR